MLEAIGSDPALRKFREEVIQFELRLATALNDVAIPEFSVLMSRTLQPDIASDSLIADWIRSNPVFLRRLAVSAVVLLCITVIGFWARAYWRQVNLESIYVDSLVQHLYDDTASLKPDTIETFSSVSRAFSHAGGRWLQPESINQMQIAYAVPCEIFPNIDSVHLLAKDNAGFFNVVLIRNSPVHREFEVGDDRFTGISFSVGSGAIVILGERSAGRSLEQLQNLKNHIAGSIDWHDQSDEGTSI